MKIGGAKHEPNLQTSIREVWSSGCICRGDPGMQLDVILLFC